MAALDLALDIRIKAPPDMVWNALTSSAGLDQFWTGAAQTEPKRGGRFVLRESADDADPEKGYYTVFTPPFRLVMTWDDALEQPVTWELSREGAGTKVELTVPGFDDDDEEAVEEAFDEWEDILAGLKEVAERWQEKDVKRKAEEAAAAAWGRPGGKSRTRTGGQGNRARKGGGRGGRR